MGRERDYGSEYHKSSNNYPRYKFRGGSKRIGKKVRRKQPEPLIPVDDDFYTPGEATAEFNRILAQLDIFDTTDSQQQPSSSPQAFKDTSTPQKVERTNPQQAPKKPGWLRRLFNPQKPNLKSSQPSNRSKSNLRIGTNEPTGGALGEKIDPDRSPTLVEFRQQVKNRANAKLEQNSTRAEQLRLDHVENPHSQTRLEQLRLSVTQDSELEAQQTQIRTYLQV